MPDWVHSRLGDLVDIKHGYAFKGEYFFEEPPGDFLLTPGNFAIGGGFQWGKRKYYRDGPVPDDFVLRPGDLIVTMTDLSKGADTLGYSAAVPESNVRLLHNQRLGKVIKKSESIDLGYVHWLLRAPDYRNEILASYTGSTVKHTSPKKILAYRFYCPPLQEQQQVATVLDSFEHKIALNNRMNETLEAMARAIFKDWFVDFGPTRAKAEGRASYLAPELWELFPDSLDDEDKPIGWVKAPVSDFVSIAQNGGTPPRKNAEYWLNGDVNWFKTGELNDGYLLTSVECINKAGLAKIGAKLWPAGTILFAIYASPTVGRMGILAEHASANQACTALVPVDEVGTPFLFEALYACRSELRNIAVGAAQQNISQKILLEHPIIQPSSALPQRYSGFVQPFFEKVLQNSCESATLETLRDFLLPKLMSGEIRLREAERTVEAVA